MKLLSKIGLGLVAVALVIVALNWQQIRYRLLVSPWFENTKYRLAGSFFRHQAKFIVDGKEEIVFDVVAACNTQISGNRATGSSVLHGKYPNIFVQRTKDGHGIGLATPSLCGSADRGLIKRQEEDGWNRKNYLPAVAWYENANDLRTGKFYASPDAYSNPRSQLKFVSSSFSAATRKEWEVWRATKDQRPANVIKPETISPPITSSNVAERKFRKFWPGKSYFGSKCQGYMRLKIVEKYRVRFRKMWPAHKPKYWVPVRKDWGTWRDDAIRGPVGKLEGQIGDRWPLDPTLFIGTVPGERPISHYWGGSGGSPFAVASKDGFTGRHNISRKISFPGEYYPVLRYNLPPLLTPENGRMKVVKWSIDMDGGRNNGYLFCQQGFIYSDEEMKYYRGKSRKDWDTGMTPPVLEVDGVKVFISHELGLVRNGADFVENDTHFWRHIGASMTGSGGVE